MKKHEVIFSTIRVPIDFCIVFGSFFVAKAIRWHTDGIPFFSFPTQTIDSMTLGAFAVFWSFLLIGLFSIHGLYNQKISSSKIKDFLEIIQYSSYWLLFFSFFIYAWNGIIYDTEIPRLIILFTTLLSTTWMILSRVFLNEIQSILMRKQIIEKNNILIIIWENSNLIHITNVIHDIHEANIYNIVGYLHKTKLDIPLPYLWNNTSATDIIQGETYRVDEVLHIENDDSKKQLQKVSEISSIAGIRYRYIPNAFDFSQASTHFSLIHSLPAVEILHESLTMWWRVWKRIFDILCSGIGLIISTPILILIGILIKIEDPSGPIIYKNTRVGQNGKTFTLYKMRYLKWKYCTKQSYGITASQDDALWYEQDLIEIQNSRSGPLYKIKNDPRKTKIGHLIEKYSIDELPQFWNVFIWNMSMVGPRPHQPREVEQYDTKHTRVLNIKPWITGMAQVNGRESNSFEEEVKLDIFYIENWSYNLDLKILFKTLGVLIRR